MQHRKIFNWCKFYVHANRAMILTTPTLWNSILDNIYVMCKIMIACMHVQLPAGSTSPA